MAISPQRLSTAKEPLLLEAPSTPLYAHPPLVCRWHGTGHEPSYLETTPRSGGYAGFYDFAERHSGDSTAAGCFLRDDTKLHDASKMESCEYDGNKSTSTPGFYADEEDGRHDIFDMSSFFREPDDLKMDADEMVNLAKEFGEKLIDPTVSTADCHADEEDHLNDQQRNESSDTVAENVMDGSDSSIDSVVMGIPYYVACQWQQMQQQQLQQQQAVMMLWWQAYLSGAYNMMGPKGTNATGQLGWSLPAAGLSGFHGAYTNLGDDSFYQHMLTMDEKGQTTNTGHKRRRKSDPNSSDDPAQNHNKKGRRPRHDERVRLQQQQQRLRDRHEC